MSMFYRKNLPLWERGMRVVVGASATAAVFGLGLDPWLKWAVVASGISFVGMGFIGFCPLCAMFGRRTVG